MAKRRGASSTLGEAILRGLASTPEGRKQAAAKREVLGAAEKNARLIEERKRRKPGR